MSVVKIAILAAVTLCVVAYPQPVANKADPPPFSPIWFVNVLFCGDALAPTSTEIEDGQKALLKCFLQSSILQQIIESIFGAGKRRRRAIDGSGSSSNEVDIEKLKLSEVYEALEKNNHLAVLIKLRKCVAKELKLLNTDETFNMSALKEGILKKVAEKPIEDNTKKGLNDCPAVVDYDVPKYMLCIASYCVTGGLVDLP